MSTIMILGGDGFCGWPTALHLSNLGHEVVIVDNLSRRRIAAELGAQSLTPIASLPRRIAAWRELTGKSIQYERLTLGREYRRFVKLLLEVQPDSVVHFAEQRAAPYSMKSPREKRYTVKNNLTATHDVLCGIAESGLDIHLAHLGTMGVYGYGAPGLRTPEGYLPVTVQTRHGPAPMEILYPTNPGSIYHMTKSQDQLFFGYYNKNNALRITDLHQGIVWGTQTPETAMDERLINRFDYDGDYGTVLNRFLMQGALGVPLTVHGTGGQTRAFIHIRDTVRCIELALAHPPKTGERVKILNQMTETHRLIDLAEMISKMTGTPYRLIDNPRNEAEQNELDVCNDSFLALGLAPLRLEEGLMSEISDIARKYADRCDLSKVPSLSSWKEPAPSLSAPDVDDDPLESEGVAQPARRTLELVAGG